MADTSFLARQQARQDITTAVECTTNLYGLPLGRLEVRDDGTAHIFTADIDDLALWLHIMHGTTTRQPAGDQLALWTLHTTTEPYANGTTIPVHVSVLLLDTEVVAYEITNALRTVA
ncbi:hypothetical protein [Streptomyces sp. AcH 505]|uniref:hypothetical protein n=1 Tax=Streptomyces sp. AcH 505 TaxID=352211 RepID=UPI00069359EE